MCGFGLQCEFFAGNIALEAPLSLFEFGCCSPSFGCTSTIKPSRCYSNPVGSWDELQCLKIYFDEKEDTSLADIIEKIRKLPKSCKVYFSQSQLC